MFPKFSVFDDADNVLLAQLQMFGDKDNDPAPRTPPNDPLNNLCDQIEGLLKAGKATTCSQAMQILAKSDPAVIDRAAEMKHALETPPTMTAEQAYRDAIETARKKHNFSFESAQVYVNKSRPDLREAFIEEHNRRHASGDHLTGKPLKAARAYWTQVQTVQREKGLSQSDAMKFVNQNFPQLRQDMVAEVNSR